MNIETSSSREVLEPNKVREVLRGHIMKWTLSYEGMRRERVESGLPQDSQDYQNEQRAITTLHAIGDVYSTLFPGESRSIPSVSELKELSSDNYIQLSEEWEAKLRELKIN